MSGVAGGGANKCLPRTNVLASKAMSVAATMVLFPVGRLMKGSWSAVDHNWGLWNGLLGVIGGMKFG